MLSKHFEDQRFIDLYWKMVRAGYVEYGKNQSSIIGVPQGGIASPILSNLILNELDEFVQDLIDSNEKENAGKTHTIRNPAYYKLDNRIQTINKINKRERTRGGCLEEALRRERDELISQRSKVSSTMPNGNLAKFYYVRYADD